MKPPYVQIKATCSKHGSFEVTRKPSKPRESGSQANRQGFYDAVKCPQCAWWATITDQVMVAEEK